MATATMATAAGAAALLYYSLRRRLGSTSSQEGEDEVSSDASQSAPTMKNRVLHRPAQAPATWLETISTLSETLRFTYSETLGKWPIGDLAFGINFLLKKQGNLHVASVYAGEDSMQLSGAEVVAELKSLLNLLTLCWHFSKKPFPLFLEETGYSQEDVLFQERKAGILKPAFTILVDKNKKCFLLLIRGTHSIRDTLTAATGAVVPFHHTIVHEGGVSNVVLGYAHCGMVAAASWIARLATPCLLKALGEYPDYEIKIVGHSLGGGTAALLTYVLREQKEFSASTCVTFAPAACMTWELAESGVHFITSVINGSDLVPTFSAASVDDLRSEVTASSWLNDLRNQIEQTRFVSTVYRSASAVGSRLQSIASARARVAGAGAILRPVSNSTQVVMNRARSVAQAALARPSLQLSSWSCMGARKRTTVALSNSKTGENEPKSFSTTITETAEPFLASHETRIITEITELPVSTAGNSEWSSELEFSCRDATMRHADEDADTTNSDEDCAGPSSGVDIMTEEELWQQLEHELYRQTENGVADMAKEIIEEDEKGVEITSVGSAPETAEAHRFFPPGKIMHIVTFPPAELENGPKGERLDGKEAGPAEARVGIFRTPRSLYSKLRLSRTMINDHYMPVYKRKIEQLIRELEEEVLTDCCDYETVL